MRARGLFVTCAIGALSSFAVEARAAPEEEPLPFGIRDLRGPVRIGTGTSRLYRAPVLSFSFEDEIALMKIAEGLDLELVVGLDAQQGPEYAPAPELVEPIRRGFFGLTVGPALGWRITPRGPLAVASTTLGPTWQAHTDQLVPRGLGVSSRIELFPFYVGIREVLRCDRGWFHTYVLSGLSGWAQGRLDWLGRDFGESGSVGFGIDLARNALLPILDAALGPICR